MTVADFAGWASEGAVGWAPMESYARLAENALDRGDAPSLDAQVVRWGKMAAAGYNRGEYHVAWICLRYAAYFQRCADSVEDARLTDEDKYGVEGAAWVQRADDRACSANGGK